jgi:hypothetical protein
LQLPQRFAGLLPVHEVCQQGIWIHFVLVGRGAHGAPLDEYIIPARTLPPPNPR